MRSNHCRQAGRLCYLVAILLTGALALRAADIPPATTLIQDTIYRANGTPARGTVVISWPAFETLDHKTVAAGVVTVTIGDGGVLSVPLVPNQGATPAGTYYRVVTKLDELKALVRTLVGNGQPGRVRLIEERLERHEALLQRGKAVVILLVPALGLVHLILHFAGKH